MSRSLRSVSLALGILLVALRGAWAAGPATTIDLTPHIEPNSMTRVTVALDGGGNDLVRAQADDKGVAGAEQKLPMSVTAKIQYDERRLNIAPGVTAGAPTTLAIRFYDQAGAVLKVDTSGLTPELARERRLITVESGPVRPALFSPEGTMPRTELDVIDAVGNSCVIDQLLPTVPIAIAGTWNQDAAVMGALLTLDSVAVCEVQSVLDEFNDSFAKVRLAGVVHGTADGAATQQEVRGVYLFDRKQRRVTRMNLAIRELRSIGGATPGVQGVAKVQIKIDPIESSPRLGDQIVATATKTDRPALRNLLYESPSLGMRIEHDRQWFVTSEGRETVSFRRIDQSDVVSQCTLTTLPPKTAGHQISLEQFQKDITYALGSNFGQLVSSRQWTSSRGNHCYQVVVRGAVEQVPVEWHYYLVAPVESGHSISMAYTIEGPMIERVGQADRAMVDAVELIPPTLAPATPPAQTAARTTESAAK